MPTLQQLRYLVALADTLHFRRAAEACHVTQPTLSAQVRELELRLGVQLVERGRHVLLTPLGAAVAEKGRRVLHEVEEIRALARTGRPSLEGTVRLGVVQTLGSYLLPLVAPELQRERPRLALTLREDLPEPLIRSLGEGALDLVMLPLPIGRGDVLAEPLFREPILAVLPGGHPLAAMDEVEPVMLSGETVLAPGPGHQLHDQLRAISEEGGARLSASYEGTNLDGLRQMVAMGMGISLMPALYVRSEVAHQTAVVARPFRAPGPGRVIGLAWRRQAPRAAEFRALGELLRGILARRAPELLILREGGAA